MGDTAFGMRLRMAREKAGLKQQTVCDQLGVLKVQTLSAYERGVNNPSIEILKELSQLYGVSTDALIFGERGSAPVKRSAEEYGRLLVEAAIHLDLDFFSEEDPYSDRARHFLRLDNLPFGDFPDFLGKWAALRRLLSNGTLSAQEYEMILSQRLEQLPLHATKEEA